MLLGKKSITIDWPDSWLLAFPNLVTSHSDLYEKLEKRPFQALCDCPGKLFVRHSDSKSEMAGLLCRVIVVKVEDRVLPQLPLRKYFVKL
jgi:hypothetical protein